MHRDGSSWSTVDTPTDDSLVAVWGAGRDDVWAAGRYGGIFRWRPSRQENRRHALPSVDEREEERPC
jgi:hypothetical protein